MDQYQKTFPQPWQSIFDALSEAVCLLDLEGRILNYNRAMLKFLKKPSDQLLGFSCCQLVHGHPEPIPECPVSRMRQSLQKETLLLSLPGRTLNLSADPIFDESGNLIGAVHILSETTEGHKTDEGSRKHPPETQGPSREPRGGWERLRLFSQGLLEARESERCRIVRELQDKTGQALLTVKLNLQAALACPESGDLSVPLNETIQIIDRVRQQLDRLSRELRPPLLDDLGLIPALRRHLEREAQRTGLMIEFSAEMPPVRLAPELETACFRLVQERLAQVLGQGQATRITVTLTAADDLLRLFLSDNGPVKGERLPGGSEEDPEWTGLEERVQGLNGQMEVSSRPDQGIEILFQIPLPL
jgi:signal transduction histidine kinase